MSAINLATLSKTASPARCRRTLKGAALAAGVVLALQTGTAQARSGACTVDSFLAAPSLEAFIGSLVGAGADIAGCVEFLELQLVDNASIANREAFARMIAAAGRQGELQFASGPGYPGGLASIPGSPGGNGSAGNASGQTTAVPVTHSGVFFIVLSATPVAGRRATAAVPIAAP